MPVLSTEDTASFASNLLLAMRQKYQVSNKDLAELINDYAKEQGITLETQVSGNFLNRLRNPAKLADKNLSHEHLQVMYDVYLRYQLLPSREDCWTGLIAVHEHLTGDDGLNLPAYLHSNGLAGWLHRYHQGKEQS